jgi:hypothetical protein
MKAPTGAFIPALSNDLRDTGIVRWPYHGRNYLGMRDAGIDTDFAILLASGVNRDRKALEGFFRS